MAGTESLRQVAHARAPWSAWFGIVLLFALFGVIVLAVIGPMPRGSDYEETRAKKRVENLKTLREEADKALTTYGWIDKNKGVARIPVGRAMELIVADLAKQKPAPPARSLRPSRKQPQALPRVLLPRPLLRLRNPAAHKHHLKRLHLLHLKERRSLVRRLHRPLPRRQLHQALLRAHESCRHPTQRTVRFRC